MAASEERHLDKWAASEIFNLKQYAEIMQIYYYYYYYYYY